jgi:hypothetical protein
MACFPVQTLLHKATSMDGVRIQQTNAMQIWNYRGKNLMEENRLLMQETYRRWILIKPIAGRISFRKTVDTSRKSGG